VATASVWLAWQATVSASLLANQLANTAFPLSKEFPFSSTVYNCEAVQAYEARLALHSVFSII